MRFCYVYFWQRGGFLDGWEGYYFARLHAMYELLCVAKTHELRKKNRINAEKLKAETLKSDNGPIRLTGGNKGNGDRSRAG
jgi:hypothetical protein